MPFEKNNTYGKNNKRGLGKNKEAIKEYLENIQSHQNFFQPVLAVYNL